MGIGHLQIKGKLSLEQTLLGCAAAEQVLASFFINSVDHDLRATCAKSEHIGPFCLVTMNISYEPGKAAEIMRLAQTGEEKLNQT